MPRAVRHILGITPGRNADDEAKMKSSLEDIARTALGLTPTLASGQARRCAIIDQEKHQAGPAAAAGSTRGRAVSRLRGWPTVQARRWCSAHIPTVPCGAKICDADRAA